MSTRQIVGMIILAGSLIIPMIWMVSYCVYLLVKEKNSEALIKIIWIIALLVGACLLLA